ncbi:hypothetical protein F4677DRAFT_456690 [Hypoxylon crocopeplum]|nr:hypothetical protein F4677DRAFT_456690 [Hypoxylon crocopeplum]
MLKFSKLLPLIEGDDNGDDHHQLATQQDAFVDAPIFTSAVDKFIHSTSTHSTSFTPNTYPLFNPNFTSPWAKAPPQLIPQYGLIGIRQDLVNAIPEDRLVLANTNMPWSAFICGSQGSGKSHTMCCLLENALVRDSTVGELPNPLAAMVMHYDIYSSYSTTQLCEAAFLCSSGIPVTVLVSPSNIWAMKRLYGNLPGLGPFSPKPKVLPLYLEESQLDIERMLKLMSIDLTADTNAPLYMEVVVNIARELAMKGGFTYSEFRRRLDGNEWVTGQSVPLSMRLQLLDSIMAPSSFTKSTRPARAKENIWAFEPGSLTIVDLSDPFYSSDDACTMFSICLSIFLEERNKCGRMVVLDEAHKFLLQSGAAKILTNDLLSVIRQQRHTGTRVLIATQEPTVSHELIALVNATFVHRFISPAWYDVLKKHLAGANKHDSSFDGSLFDTIVSLRTGQALLFCPTAQVDLVEAPVNGGWMMKSLGNGYLKVKIRKRLTMDGGKSIMASDVSARDPHPTQVDIPMHVVDQKRNINRVTRGKELRRRSSNESMEYVPDVDLSNDTQTMLVHTTRNNPPRSAKLKSELNRQAEAMFKFEWYLFTRLTHEHRTELYRRVDTALGLRPGTALSDRDIVHYCEYDGLDTYLAACKQRDMDKIAKLNKH